MRYLRQSVHISWLIALASLLFVVGVWLALYVRIEHWWLAVAALLGLGVSFWRQKTYVLPFIVLSGGALGLWYGSVSIGDLKVYEPFIGKQVTVSGRVKDDPSQNAKNQLVVQIDHVQMAEHDLPGSVWVSVIGHPRIKRSDEVVVMGKLTQGFGTFAGVMYTAKIISFTPLPSSDPGRVVRDWFADAVRQAIPEPQASLGIGYVTGQKSALPADLSKALQIAGLSHVVVASGYNLTILVRLARRLFMRVSKFASVLASGIMIMSFIAVTGLSPSMTRAGLVSGMSLLTWYYGRRFHPFILLPFAAALTTVMQPSYAWGDIGWQLSFAAFAGVMILGPLLQHFFFGDKEPGTIRQILGESVAAHIITLPIVATAFGMISNVAVPANIAIVPLVPLAMLLTFISGIAALVVPPIATFVALPATWLLTYMTTTAQFLSDLPWSQTTFEPAWWMSLVFYVLLIVACGVMWRVTRFDFRGRSIIE